MTMTRDWRVDKRSTVARDKVVDERSMVTRDERVDERSTVIGLRGKSADGRRTRGTGDSTGGRLRSGTRVLSEQLIDCTRVKNKLGKYEGRGETGLRK